MGNGHWYPLEISLDPGIYISLGKGYLRGGGHTRVLQGSAAASCSHRWALKGRAWCAQCTPKGVRKVRSRCDQGAPKMRATCAQGAPMVRPRCAQGVRKVRSRCAQGAPKVPPRVCAQGAPKARPRCAQGAPYGARKVRAKCAQCAPKVRADARKVRPRRAQGAPKARARCAQGAPKCARSTGHVSLDRHACLSRDACLVSRLPRLSAAPPAFPLQLPYSSVTPRLTPPLLRDPGAAFVLPPASVHALASAAARS